jgi:hypothetical protein
MALPDTAATEPAAAPAAEPAPGDPPRARSIAAALLALLAAGYLTGLPYLDLQAGLPIPLPIARFDVLHVASGVGAAAFALCLALRLRRGRRGWTPWMNGLLGAAAILYAGVAATGVVILLPLPADLADELTHGHLIAAVWAAEPTLALLYELGRRGELRGPLHAARLRGRWPAWVLPGRAAGAALLGLAALAPAIVLATLAPRALSPSAQRGGYESWQPIGPRTVLDVSMLAPGGRSVIAGGLGLYEVGLDGSWHQLGDFGDQDVLDLVMAPGGTVYVGTSVGLYRAPDLDGPYTRMPLPTGGVHGIVVLGSVIWASSYDGFYRSADGGRHWQLENAGLAYPDRAWALVDYRGTLYGTDVAGVYRWEDDRWEQVSHQVNVVTFTLTPGGRLIAGSMGGGIRVLAPSGRWEESDTGLISHNQGAIQGIHEISATVGPSGRAYGGSMLEGGDVSLDGGSTWSQQWPDLSRDGDVWRILPDGRDLVAATDSGLFLYRLPQTAPAGPGWWALSIGATLAAALLIAALLLGRVLPSHDRKVGRRTFAGVSTPSAR